MTLGCISLIDDHQWTIKKVFFVTIVQELFDGPLLSSPRYQWPFMCRRVVKLNLRKCWIMVEHVLMKAHQISLEKAKILGYTWVFGINWSSPRSVCHTFNSLTSRLSSTSLWMPSCFRRIFKHWTLAITSTKAWRGSSFPMLFNT